MMKMVNRVILSAAAASLAVLPIAAQANTRAGDNGAVYSASAPGLGRSVDGEALEDDSTGIVLALIAAGLIITGIVFATQSDDDGQSPGT